MSVGEGAAPYGETPTRHTLTVGKRGTLVLPAEVRRRLGLDEGALVLAEEAEGGLLLRRAEAVPIEIYTPERIAEFLLSSAIGPEDYADAAREVRGMGLDPEKILHYKPRGVA
ncbi:MAG: AbrB/MazE/SpoVT family DNA-binding domain-containing protein [Bdellovibrionota bacterium]